MFRDFRLSVTEIFQLSQLCILIIIHLHSIPYYEDVPVSYCHPSSESKSSSFLRYMRFPNEEENYEVRGQEQGKKIIMKIEKKGLRYQTKITT